MTMYKDWHLPSTFLWPSSWLQEFSVGLTFSSGTWTLRYGNRTGSWKGALLCACFLFLRVPNADYVLRVHELSCGSSLHCVFDKLLEAWGRVRRVRRKVKWREWQVLALPIQAWRDSLIPGSKNMSTPQADFSQFPSFFFPGSYC